MDISSADLDFSAFDRQDLMNIVLQRSEVLDRRRDGAPVKQWEEGDDAALRRVAEQRGTDIARDSAAVILKEFRAVLPVLEEFQPERIADIGCGYAIFDLFAYHALGTELLLIDIEHSEDRHFGFQEAGAGYSSLARARRFLTDNGVPDRAITTWNPQTQEMPAGAPLDIAVSFISCGFHYPVDSYLPFFEYAVRPGGGVILDLRGKRMSESIRKLARLGEVHKLDKLQKGQRVLLRTRARA